MDDGSASPGVLRMLGSVAAEVSFEISSGLLWDLAGLRIDAKQVERMAERLGEEMAEDERQYERRGRVAVVDHDPEMPFADRRRVETREQVGGVDVGRARRIRDRSDVRRRDPAELLAREVLLDLLLRRRGQLDARALVELDPYDLRIGRTDSDVDARVVALGLQ